ncbi:MAG: hypothetical protein K0R49_1543 [Burkholderiales bacterium]|jgi:uncharacterized protein YaeQ|nr:hypothetical protein [Burkholderiales bacterium]MCE3269291.1 hypothetical protein [Burkholderiales bacterium]
MTLKPRIFKINIQIADMDRHYYHDHLLTIAQHPSETDERMMVRILAFALNANNNLSFADGISDANSADLWDKDYNSQIALWISVGLPDEKIIRKAVSRSKQVIIYSYGGKPVTIWWSKLKLNDYPNLKVINLLEENTKELALLLSRGMKMNFTISEGEIMVSNDAACLNITPQILK